MTEELREVILRLRRAIKRHKEDDPSGRHEESRWGMKYAHDICCWVLGEKMDDHIQDYYDQTFPDWYNKPRPE